MSKKGKAGFITERETAQRYAVTTRSLARWDQRPDLKFPKPVLILNRRYREISALDAWDIANARKPVVHSLHWAEGQPRAARGRFKKLAKKLERKPAKRSLDHHQR